MKKKSKSIAFSICVFFVVLNVISFMTMFYITGEQYYRIARENLHDRGMMVASDLQSKFNDMRFYMNDLTLKVYSDRELNAICSELYRGEYQDQAELETLIHQAESLCFDYLYYYSFIQSLGIAIENPEKTDIQLRRNNKAISTKKCREEIQDEIIANQGVIACFDVGETHQIIFARTLRDFENVLKDNRIIGTVMVNLSSQYMQDTLDYALITPNSAAFLKNQEGDISYSTVKGQQGKTESELIETAVGKKYEMISVPIEILDQTLVIVIPDKDIRMSIEEFLRTLVLFVLVMLILNLILVLVISKYLTRPMDRLVDQIQKVGVTSFENQQIWAYGYSEIENIAENFNRMLERMELLVTENYKISLNEKNARIEALQSQINPHFIFNTLDTINWKVMFLNVPEVSNMITYLGDMLRYTTYQYGKYVTVEQELAQIQNYIYIQEIRYDHSFEARYIVEESAKKEVIPCLIIQPLVENAVVHGLRGKRDGILMVKIKMIVDILEIHVIDNGQGMDEKTIAEILDEKSMNNRESIGLANVNQRIRLTYSLKEGLLIKSRKGHYTSVKMRIPISKGEERGKEQYDTGNRSR